MTTQKHFIHRFCIKSSTINLHRVKFVVTCNQNKKAKSLEKCMFLVFGNKYVWPTYHPGSTDRLDLRSW